MRTDARCRTRARTAGGRDEAVFVSHHFRVVTVLGFRGGTGLWHDPRRRSASLASITSL